MQSRRCNMVEATIRAMRFALDMLIMMSLAKQSTVPQILSIIKL